jgi:hypothetical protein
MRIAGIEAVTLCRDGLQRPRTGPLLSFGRVALADLERQSLRPDEQTTLFFLAGRVSNFDRHLVRYLAMKETSGRSRTYWRVRPAPPRISRN